MIVDCVCVRIFVGCLYSFIMHEHRVQFLHEIHLYFLFSVACRVNMWYFLWTCVYCPLNFLMEHNQEKNRRIYVFLLFQLIICTFRWSFLCCYKHKQFILDFRNAIYALNEYCTAQFFVCIAFFPTSIFLTHMHRLLIIQIFYIWFFHLITTRFSNLKCYSI